MATRSAGSEKRHPTPSTHTHTHTHTGGNSIALCQITHWTYLLCSCLTIQSDRRESITHFGNCGFSAWLEDKWEYQDRQITKENWWICPIICAGAQQVCCLCTKEHLRGVQELVLLHGRGWWAKCAWWRQQVFSEGVVKDFLEQILLVAWRDGLCHKLIGMFLVAWFASIQLTLWFHETIWVSFHSKEEGRAALLSIGVGYFRLQASSWTALFLLRACF